MRTAVNRTVLTLVGLILLGAGGLGLALGWGAFGSTWQHRPVVTDWFRRRLLTSGWWWPTVYAVLSAVAVLALLLLLAQFRRNRLSTARADVPEGGGTAAAPDSAAWPDPGHTTVLGRAMAGAVADAAEQLPGVRRASARLTGRPREPRLEIGLVVTADADLDAVLEQLRAGPLEQAAEGLSVPAVPTVVAVSSARGGTPRTR